jgi:DNA repair protein RadC
MTQAQKVAKDKFKKAIEYRKKTGVSLKEAFAHIYGKKVGAVKKKAAPKKKAAVKKKDAPKKKAAPKKATGLHKDTKSHNVNIKVVSGTKKKKVGDYISKDTVYKDSRGYRKLGKGSYNVTRSKDGTFANFSKIAGKIPSEFVSLSGYSYGKEIIVAGVGKLSILKNLVPEVKLRVTRGKKSSSDIITSAKVASEIFKRFIGKNKIDTQELVAVAYLSQSNKVLGVYVHTIGSISSANVDVRLILAGALQMGAVSLVLCHNHPSGNLKPSDADKTVTKQLIKASSYHSINVLDHIIITKESYFSFAENGLI